MFLLIVYFFNGFVKNTLSLRRKTCYTDNMEKRVELYHPDALPEKREKKKKLRAVMLCIGGIGLLACILFCVFATRRNQHLLLPLTIGTSVLTGWIVITFLHGSYGRANADVRHCELMLSEPRVEQRGRFRKTDEVRRMRNGMHVRKVLLFEGDRERLLSVSEQKAAQLPDAFSGTAETVYDFIVAYEVNGDD